MSSLEFVRYSFGEVKYDVAECLQRGMTYEVPMKITVRLIVYDLDKDTGSQTIGISRNKIFISEPFP